MEGIGWYDGFDFAFDFINKFFLGETVTIGAHGKEGIVISIEIDTGKSGTSKVV